MEDRRGRVVVNAGQGVIEHQQGCLHQQGPAQGRALPLATAEGDAPLPHQGLVSIRKPLDIPLQPGLAGGLLHLPQRRFRFAVAQVVRQGGGEQVALLGHQPHPIAQG